MLLAKPAGQAGLDKEFQEWLKIVTIGSALGIPIPPMPKGQPAKPPENSPPQIAGHDNLGYLSGIGESGNDPGVISSGNGDSGGKSYGAFQFSSVWKVQEEFLKWLEAEDGDIYERLEAGFEADGNASGKNFDAAWKQIAAENGEKFYKLQYEFTQYTYFDSIVGKIENNTGFDINGRGYALKNVIWSRSVHHGSSGFTRIAEKVLSTLDPKTASDEEIIRALYMESGAVVDYPPSEKSVPMTGPDAERLGLSGKYMKYFSANSSDAQIGVFIRLQHEELERALEYLKKYG
jgi:hypothetical protein